MKESVLVMSVRVWLSWFVGAALMTSLSPAFGQSGSVSSITLQGQNKGNTNSWSAGNLMGWQELDFIPCRVLFAGSGNDQTITITFPHLSGTTPGFENLFDFTTSSNVSFTSAPVLSAPASGDWSYTFTVNINNGGSVNFFARLAAGSHLNVGSSLQLGGTPQSMGQLQIHKPAPGPGAPDLSVVKTGPPIVAAGGTIFYTLTYSNKAVGTNVGIGVQISDILPPGVTIDTNGLPAGANYAGNTIFFDLPDLAPGAGGQITFAAGVPEGTASGTVLTNFAQILSSQNDADMADNTSTWLTTVVGGCASCIIGYPYSSTNPLTSIPFNESSVLAAFNTNVTGITDTIRLFYNDEHAMTLGISRVAVRTSGGWATNTYSVAPLGSDPGSTTNPAVGSTILSGAQAGVDVTNRPMFPSLFVTDVTQDPSDRSGDWQFGGTPIPPEFVSGSWKGAVKSVDETVNPPKVTITPDSDPAQNNWNLGPGADSVPAGLSNQGYGCEARWNVADLKLLPGHSYRLYFMVHDGDQNQAGGDTGQGCVTICVPCAPLVATPLENQAVCVGQTAIFSTTVEGGTGPYAYPFSFQWYNGQTALTGQTNSSLILTNVAATDAGTYTVIVTGSCGAPVTNSATLTINANISVTVPPADATSCPGTTANFSVNATGTDLSYQWYQGATLLTGQTNSTLTIGSVTAANAGTYSVVITGACGTSVTNSATLTVNANTLVTVPPANATNCPGTTANFSVNATGTGLSYQWYHGATLLSGQTGSTLTIPNVSAANAGTYNVVITGACGTSVTNSAILTINASVLVTIPPLNTTNCPGTTANFSVNATGTDLSYQWYQGTTPLVGQTSSTLTITNVSGANAGIYSVVITGACGTSVTNSAFLAVNASTLITTAPVNSTNCSGTTANFSVNAIGTGLAYQWYGGTNVLTGQTNSTLTITNVSAEDAGTYSIVITGECGSTMTNSAVLAVNQNLLVSIPPRDQTVCPGGTANLSVNATGTDLTYQWYQGATLLAGETAGTLTLTNVSAANAGIYNVVVSGACGSSMTNSAMLSVNTDVLVTVPPANSTNCPGTTANFSVNAIGSGLAYQWYQGTNLLAGQTASTLTLTNVSAGNAGIYTVIVSGACAGSVTNSAMLIVNADTLVTIPPSNSTNCPGTTANFSVNATGTSLTYQWYEGATLLPGQTTTTLTLADVNASSAGTYSVVITGACGSSVTNSALLVVNANTLVTIPAANSTNCPGTTANFSVNATGTDLSYQWYHGAVLLSGQTGSALTVPNVGEASAGMYSVVITGACGALVTNSAILAVNTNAFVVMPPINSTNCPGTTANFSVNATGSGLAYQWYHGADLLIGQTAGTLTLSDVNAGNAGTYSVVITGECGSSLTNSAVLVVNQNVSVAPLANVTNIVGSSATFTAVASGTGPFTYQWSHGANELPGQTNSTLTLNDLQPTNGGAYSVSVSGACGTAATAGFVLTIHLPPVVSITYPTNGQVFVAPATFDVMANASEPDGVITNVQFFYSTNGLDFIFLGQTNNTPYLTIASNLAAGSYTLIATAADNFGASAQSAPVTVEVVPPEPPTVTVIGHMTLNLQDGYQWLSNVVCNPDESYADAVRIYVHNITNSTIQVVNATGTNNGLPYIESPAAIQPGTCWTNVIMFFDPYGFQFSPILTVELVPPPNAAGNPTGTMVPMMPPKMLPNGTFLIEFASTAGSTYYVQYSSDMLNWNTSFPAITGSGQHMQWIDAGPPLTASLPAANPKRFYRVILAQ